MIVYILPYYCQILPKMPYMRLKVGTVRKFVKTIVVHEHKSLFSFLYPS